jgi:hypothetical protein
MTAAEPSSKRAEANRRNAQKSTGPKTAEGKERSRLNAVKHGLRAKTPVLPGEDPLALQSRMDAWMVDLQPRDEVERFLVGRAVQLSWQLDRADRALAGRSGGSDGLDDQADEVAALGRRLLWDPRGPTFFYPQFEITLGDPKRVSWSGLSDDPDDPARLLNRLESTPLGCAWLLDRWAELKDALEAGRNWEPRDRFKAIRLLGRQPLDIDDDGRVLTIYACCTAMDTTGSIALKDLTNELHWNEQKRLADWITRRWAEPEDRPDAETAMAALLALVGAEEDRLEDALATLLDGPPPSAAAAAFDPSDAAERLRRYQATCDRTLLRVLEALRKRRRDADGSGTGRQRQARPPKETAPDPLRGVAGLLDLIAAARDARTTTAADRPVDAPAPSPATADMATRAPEKPDDTRIEATPAEPADASRPLPIAESPTAATNEPNHLAADTPRRVPTRPAGLRILLVFLFCAGMSAAFGLSRVWMRAVNGWMAIGLTAARAPGRSVRTAEPDGPDRVGQAVLPDAGRSDRPDRSQAGRSDRRPRPARSDATRVLGASVRIPGRHDTVDNLAIGTAIAYHRGATNPQRGGSVPQGNGRTGDVIPRAVAAEPGS